MVTCSGLNKSNHIRSRHAIIVIDLFKKYLQRFVHLYTHA